MGDLWLQVLPRSAADRETLYQDFRPKVLAEDAEGYETMLRVAPDDVTLHADVASIYWALDQVERAIAHYHEALHLAPNDAKIRYNLGTLLLQQGRAADAAAQFEQTVKRDPAHAEAHNNLGAALLSLGDVAAGAGHFTAALELNPDHAAALGNLGYALILMDRVDEGIARLRRALVLNRDLQDAHYHLARALTRRGELREATDHHREALRLAPDWPLPMTELAWLLATSPEVLAPGEALRLADRAVTLTGHRNVAALDALAAAYAATGRFDDAVRTETEALALADEAGADEVASELRLRINLYGNGQRYTVRMPAPASR
jgi:tetratricopeptide (TPR) repeat protein